MKKFRIAVLFFIMILSVGIKVNAASANVKNFSFTIIANEWRSFSSGKYSYKYYDGTQKTDRSAYVINMENNSAQTMKHYYQNNNTRKSNVFLQRGIKVRSTYANWGQKGHTGKFWGQRENIFDPSGTVKGTWSSDDGRK